VKLSKYHRERDVQTRSKQAYALRQTGMSYRQIGLTLQPPVSGNRASQLVRAAERRMLCSWQRHVRELVKTIETGRMMGNCEFVSRRSERGRNVVVIRAPQGASNAAVIAFAERVGPDRNPFGCQVRRYGDEAEVAFFTD